MPPRSSSPSSKAAERARAQLLHRPRGVDVVGRLLAVQAQDARSVNFLPAFDELLLGYVDRTPTVPAEYERVVHPGGGILRLVVLEDGVATGTWRLRGGEVVVDPFTASSSAASP